jgi:uncharacterized protein (TIGR03437 family)
MISDGTVLRDERNRPIVLLGADAPMFTEELAVTGGGNATGAFFRMRSWNMNAVRIRTSIAAWRRNPAGYLARLAQLAETARQQSVVLILAPAMGEDPETVEYWRAVSAHVKDWANLVFDLSLQPADPQPLADAIRAAGATQPVIAAAGQHLVDPNAIYAARAGLDPEDWDRTFAPLLGRAPLMAIDWRLPNGAPECAGLDRAQAAQLARRFFDYAEDRSISIIINGLEEPDFRRDYSALSEHALPSDWSCDSPPGYGLAPLILWRLTGNPNGAQWLRSVSSADADSAIAPGSLATAYGSGTAPASARAESLPLPTRLLNVGLEITDSTGRRFEAPLLAISPSQINYVVPQDAAPGPALTRLLLPLAPGVESRVTGAVTIRRVAPAIFPMGAGGLRQRPGVSELEPFDVFRCTSSGIGGVFCSRVPIAIPPGTAVYLSLYTTGIRGRDPSTPMAVKVGAITVPILYAGPQGSFEGLDQVNVLLPESLRGSGLVEVAVGIGGEWSNPLAIVIQ